MNNIAATLRGKDNDCYMVASCEKQLHDAPDGVFCPQCGWKRDWTYTRPTFVLGKRRFDVSTTYDGALIISNNVKKIFESFSIAESEFTRIALDPEYFHLKPSTILPFDIERRKTRLGKLCRVCNLHDTVAGATPAFLKQSVPDNLHVFRSDLLFGSYNEHRPLIFISNTLSQALCSATLSGLEIEPINAEQIRISS